MDKATSPGGSSKSPPCDCRTPTQPEHVSTARVGRRSQNRSSPRCRSSRTMSCVVAYLLLWAEGRRFNDSDAVGEGPHRPIREKLAKEGERNHSRVTGNPPCSTWRTAGTVSFSRLLRLAHEWVRSSMSSSTHRPDVLFAAGVGNASCAPQVSGAQKVLHCETWTNCQKVGVSDGAIQKS